MSNDEMREEISRLQGNNFAMELMLGYALNFILRWQDGRLTADDIAAGFNEIPDALAERYGLDSRPGFKNGVTESVENVSRAMRRSV